MVRALPHGSDTRIDSGRIAALAAAIAVHAIALLMLLMPMAAPPIKPVALDAPKDPIFQIYEKKVLPDPVPVIEERKIVTVVFHSPTIQSSSRMRLAGSAAAAFRRGVFLSCS